MQELYSDAPEDLRRGYAEEEGAYRCLFCGQTYRRGDIYAFGERLVDGATAMALHGEAAHGSAFEALLAQGKRVTGLSEAQEALLTCLYDGLPDRETAARMGVTPATVRVQRFRLRERARQARVFLALFEQAEARAKTEPEPLAHPGATMVDERYVVTEDERQHVLRNFCHSTEPLVLRAFPPKEKKKLVLLRLVAEQFVSGRLYNEKEINEVLKGNFGDYVTLRRYLIEYGFMERRVDGSGYWRKT